MLDARRVLSRDGLEIQDVKCRHGRGRGPGEVHDGRHALVLVRRGCFLRHADGAATTLDPTLAYCMNPGVEHSYDHPDGEGDDCTAIFFEPSVLASLWGGDPRLPTAGIPVPPALDLEHRGLLAAAREGHDPVAAADRAVELTAAVLKQADADRVASGRPSACTARKALADAAREALSLDPNLSLGALARLVAISPHHLSRVFRAETGHTIARHRMRLRTRAVLERLAGGECDLARLAADTGFADQSHLCRVLRAEIDRTPSAARAILAR
jgi:AraC-like DNA-binding protein